MNHALPKLQHFPKINRFITEKVFSQDAFFFLKYFFIGSVCGGLIIAIALQALALNDNIQRSKSLAKERERVTKEIVYWKQIANTYDGYRDIYFRIAALQYKLGNKEESKKYVQKALELDPNFEEARVLGAKVGF